MLIFRGRARELHTVECCYNAVQVKRRQSQRYKFKKFAKISNFWILKWVLHATHLLKLLDKMCKYEMDTMSIVEDTERTRFCPQTDRRTDGQGDTSILPFQLRWSGGYSYCIRLQFSTLSWHVHNCDLTEPLESKSEQWFKPKSFMKIWIGNWIHMSNWYKIYSITGQNIMSQKTQSCVAGYSTS